jgi:hypothetical protein
VSKYGNMFTLSSDDYVGQSLRVLGEVREIIGVHRHHHATTTLD